MEIRKLTSIFGIKKNLKIKKEKKRQNIYSS